MSGEWTIGISDRSALYAVDGRNDASERLAETARWRVFDQTLFGRPGTVDVVFPRRRRRDDEAALLGRSHEDLPAGHFVNVAQFIVPAATRTRSSTASRRTHPLISEPSDRDPTMLAKLGSMVARTLSQ